MFSKGSFSSSTLCLFIGSFLFVLFGLQTLFFKLYSWKHSCSSLRFSCSHFFGSCCFPVSEGWKAGRVSGLLMAQHSDKHSFVQVSYTFSSILFTGYNCDHSRVSFPVFTFKNPPLDFLTPLPVHLRLPTDYHKHVQSIVPFTTTIVPHFILECTIPGRYFFTSILCKIPGLKFTSLRHHPCHLSLAGPIFYLPHSHISLGFKFFFWCDILYFSSLFYNWNEAVCQAKTFNSNNKLSES